MVPIIIDAAEREQLITTINSQGVLLFRKEEIVGAMTALFLIRTLMTITDQVDLYVEVVGAMTSLLPMVTIIIEEAVWVQGFITNQVALSIKILST